MKQLFIILLLVVTSGIGYAQTNLVNAAFAKYKVGDYASAIKLYNAKIVKRATLYDRYMLAECYLKTDSVPQAKLEFNKIINDTTTVSLYMGIKTEACDALAKQYLKETDYRQALYYYRLYARIFEKARFADVNLARFHFFNAYDQARCYQTLKLTDSAIVVMTPYMFYTYKALTQFMFQSPNYSNPKDSLQHDTITRYYLSLLRSRYSNKRIKAEFKKAIDNFKFTEDQQPDEHYGFVFENIACSIDIYEIHIVFLGGGIGNKAELLIKEIQLPYYTKTYQLEQFRQLPIYRMVRELPN